MALLADAPELAALLEEMRAGLAEVGGRAAGHARRAATV